MECTKISEQFDILTWIPNVHRECCFTLTQCQSVSTFECLLSFIYNYSTRSKHHHNRQNRFRSITIRESAILQVCGLYTVCEIIRGLYRKVVVFDIQK